MPTLKLAALVLLIGSWFGVALAATPPAATANWVLSRSRLAHGIAMPETSQLALIGAGLVLVSWCSRKMLHR